MPLYAVLIRLHKYDKELTVRQVGKPSLGEVVMLEQTKLLQAPAMYLFYSAKLR